jgi:Cdc6-like AAA superfamily ATPase
MKRYNIPLYLKHYGYLNRIPDIYRIFFPGTANSTPENKHNDLIIITSRKGSGKTELAKYMSDVYHKNNPNNRVIVLCGIKDLYNDLPYAKVIDLKLIEEEENNKKKNDYSGMPDVSDFKDSLVIFDDTEQYPNPKVESMLYQLCNVIAQNGRNYNTSMICILHQINKGKHSSTLIREADTIIIFPRSFDQNTFNTLVNHYGISKDEVLRLYSYRDEWFILIHITQPSYIFYSNSMVKEDI